MHGISDIWSDKLVIENYHLFARGYLDSLGKMPSYNGIFEPEEKAYHIEKAVEALKEQHPNESTYRRSTEFFIDEIAFIQKFGFPDLDTYNEADRIGRAAANIRRENRKWIYAAYEKYKELREAAGRKYDWDDLAFYVYNELQNDDRFRMYSHIIVDEGQDFSPMMIKSLVDAVADDGSFTFFGDVAQQIYGSRLSWRDSGINVEKVWRFEVNYRNPATITAFATDLTKSKYWLHDDDMVEATSQIAEGPKPTLIGFTSEQREIEWVVERAISIGRTSSTVIVCRNRADIDSFLHILKNKGYSATEINRYTPGFAHINTVYLTTYHAAKGLEFDNVFIPHLTDDKLPDPETVANAVSVKDAYADELKLLYVAVTRSKYGLYMTYSNNITPLFPKDTDSYDYHYEEDMI
ncbi:MAG: UvrD-helicase domain-containing protein [Oscillospiraceae bacterium]|nr:UvrD-helicase domain-containing protein [Oscillospiraceae bacterium]